MTQYYLSEGQQPRGPFPLDELRAQGLTPLSLVWHEQMTDWLPATVVPEVQALLPKLPPALPKMPRRYLNHLHSYPSHPALRPSGE